MELQEQLEQWHQEKAHEKIIDAVEAIPEEKREFDLISRLGRAYNNVSRYGEAVAALKPLEAQGKDDALWNYRIAYAYYHKFEISGNKLEQYKQALSYFTRALELGDEDARSFCQLCKNEIAAYTIE